MKQTLNVHFFIVLISKQNKVVFHDGNQKPRDCSLCLSRSTMYAYTKFATVDKDFVFLECLLFGALISATDPGMSFKMVIV